MEMSFASNLLTILGLFSIVVVFCAMIRDWGVKVPARLNRLTLRQLIKFFDPDNIGQVSEFDRNRIVYAILEKIKEQVSVNRWEDRPFFLQFFTGYLIWKKEMKHTPDRTQHLDSKLIQRFLSTASQNISVSEALRIKKALEWAFLQSLDHLEKVTTLKSSKEDFDAVKFLIKNYCVQGIIGKFQKKLIPIDSEFKLSEALYETGEFYLFDELTMWAVRLGFEDNDRMKKVLLEYSEENNTEPKFFKELEVQFA